MLEFILDHGPVIYVSVCLFILGAVVGSFLNVWIARLPLEKSIFWPPGSRCGNCCRSIRFFDNLPLLSYWLLRGKCRYCKAPFSIRYFAVELFVASAFVLIFYLEIVLNIHDIPEFRNVARQLKFNVFDARNVPAFFYWLHHATLVCFLLAAASCDLEDRSIPLSITMTGTIIGLLFATFLPWPWPIADIQAALPHPRMPINEWWELGPNEMQKLGLYPWPVWGPLPAWLRPGSWRLGLATGLAGALCGTFMLRGVKFLFEKGFGKEALGLGDADLMMMVGAFLGWQPTLVAFLVGAVVSLVFTAPFLLLRGKNSLPFGPGLAVGAVITGLSWDSIGPVLQVLLFNSKLMALLVGVCAVATFLLAFLMRSLRGGASAAPEEVTMTDALVIVDYGMANLRSVQKAFEHVGQPALISSVPEQIAAAQKLVLPGVGAFCDGIAQLRRSGLTEPIFEHVRAGRPLLGICLGLQFLFTRSHEDGVFAGLDLFKGDVVRFENQPGLKVPHMGWNQLRLRRKNCPLFRGLNDGDAVYFVHSYYAAPQAPEIVAAEADYPTPFAAAIWQDNVFATQFHPEKSQKVGLTMLRNFAEL